MVVQTGLRSGPGPVVGFYADLEELRKSSGRKVPALAPKLRLSEKQLYAILAGNRKTPPDWVKFVRPLVQECTNGDAKQLAAWERRYERVVDLYEELSRRQRQSPPTAEAHNPPESGEGLIATDIHLTAKDRRVFIESMAVIYDDETAIFRMLDQIDFPRPRRPAFDGRTPIAVWHDIFGEFSRGITPTPYKDLLLASLRLYPGNKRLQRLSGRYLALGGESAVAGPRVHSDPVSASYPSSASDQPELLMSIYIPNERLYAAEQRRLLAMFRDWLAKTRKQGIRQSERSTSRGAMFEYYADGSVSLPELKAEMDVFAHFLNKCVDSPVSALNFLSETPMRPEAATELVTQFGKEARRVEVDVRHAHERGLLTLKQTLENALLENGVNLRAMPGTQINALLEELVPYPDTGSAFAALTGPAVIHLPMNANVTFQQNIYSAVEQTIIDHVQGTVNLGVQAKEILGLIDHFAARSEAPTLTTAIHELEDPDAPADSRKSAKVKLKKFVASLSGKVEDAALTVLEKYLESKLGL